MPEKHYYRFISYSDGSGYVGGWIIKLLTPAQAEKKNRGGDVWVRID